MANKPSQMCRCCSGQGCSGWPIVKCPLCQGKGKITIKMAKAIGWRPVVHRKRKQHPSNMVMFA